MLSSVKTYGVTSSNGWPGSLPRGGSKSSEAERVNRTWWSKEKRKVFQEAGQPMERHSKCKRDRRPMWSWNLGGKEQNHEMKLERQTR